MRVSISVTMVSLLMEVLDKMVLSTFTPVPKVFYCYIDKYFDILKKQGVPWFLGRLDNQNVHIHFTVELEKGSLLCFLHVMVCWNEGLEGILAFSGYRKPAGTGSYLSFTSYHPVGHKMFVVLFLTMCAIGVCSDGNALKMKNELNTICVA